MSGLANLSIDWLKEVDSVRRGSRLDRSYSMDDSSFLEEAVLAYSGKLLQGLMKEPAERARLHDLVSRLRLPLKDTLPVVNFLEERGYIQLDDEDPVLGNHLIRLTSAGERVAG